jgi:hypothetical protein
MIVFQLLTGAPRKTHAGQRTDVQRHANIRPKLVCNGFLCTLFMLIDCENPNTLL